MDILKALTAALGPEVVKGPQDVDLSTRLGDMAIIPPAANTPIALVLPRTTDEVSTALRLCHAAGIPVTPQGGQTGLAGGGAAVPGGVALGLSRMNRIEEIDLDAAAMTVQAGTPLQVIQQAAETAGLYFALDLGARGSCQIGGNLSTNAGGNHVLRYGMARAQVLGLEAVLADGTVLTGLNKMLKNNTGYDLKQLFIGSEGTLGVITRAVLRLHPAPRSVATAVCAVRDYAAVLALLARAKAGLPGLTAFEVMWAPFYHYCTEGFGRLPPVPYGHHAYVIVESMGSDPANDPAVFEAVIAGALEAGVLSDVVIAQSGRERTAIWDIRDSAGELYKAMGANIGFDVSIPVGRIGEYIDRCQAALRERWSDAQSVFFGHAADSNIHISVRLGGNALPRDDIEAVVYGVVREFSGSVSAEHGIGLLKKPYLGHSRTPAEIAVMHTLKQALDPKGILNPGKVLS